MANHVPQQHGPRGSYRLRKKLRRALQHLTDGRSLEEAAALVRMTAPGLKVALRKPHVLALFEEKAHAQQSGLLPKAVLTFERVMDSRLRQPMPGMSARPLTEAERQMVRLREIIAELRRDGHDSQPGINLLHQFEQTLASYIANRNRLRKELELPPLRR
jgi:hypothetical protein